MPVHRTPPPRALTLESIADLRSLRESVHQRWKLPRLRITLRLPGLNPANSLHYERQLNRQLAQSGGWAALSTAAALTALTACFPMSPAGLGGLATFGAWAAQVVLGGTLGWWVGKGSAIGFAHGRFVWLCRRLEADLAA